MRTSAERRENFDGGGGLLSENHSLVLVGKYLSLDVLCHCAGEDDLFEVAALQHQRIGSVLVGDAHDVLLDDGAGVEFGGHVVGGRPDDLHSSLVCLVVGLRSDECGQEGVVDVDDVVRVRLYHPVADHLHVAGEHDEGDVLILEYLHLPGLNLGLVVGGDGKAVIRDSELLADVAKVFVVADDARNLDVPLAGVVTREKVVDAVAHLADEDRHPRLLVREVYAEIHPVAGTEHRVDVFSDLFTGNQEPVEFPLYPHEEDLLDSVDVLVEVDDISAVVRDELRHVSDYSLPVRAVEKEYCGLVFHNSSL